jgi:hypothetical protein
VFVAAVIQKAAVEGVRKWHFGGDEYLEGGWVCPCDTKGRAALDGSMIGVSESAAGVFDSLGYVRRSLDEIPSVNLWIWSFKKKYACRLHTN